MPIFMYKIVQVNVPIYAYLRLYTVYALGAIITPNDIFNLIPLYSSTIEDIQVEVFLLCFLLPIVSVSIKISS